MCTRTPRSWRNRRIAPKELAKVGVAGSNPAAPISGPSPINGRSPLEYQSKPGTDFVVVVCDESVHRDRVVHHDSDGSSFTQAQSELASSSHLGAPPPGFIDVQHGSRGECRRRHKT